MELSLPDFAKITRPKASRLTERPRLFEALGQALQGSATWVSAPPGFGKTSLVSSYVEHRGLDCLWYRVDEEDADVGNFFYYLNQASQNLPCHDGDLPAFTPDNLPSLGAFARRFFERLCARLRPPALLVFDDHQRAAADAPLHGILANAVEHLPDGIHVLVLSREPPSAAYARLRANGALAWLDYEQLKLTYAEVSAITRERASKHTNDDVTPAYIEKLCAVTHGWAAGLTLLLEHGRAARLDHDHDSCPPPSGDTATPQVVFDYFAGEVFQRLDSAQRNIIVQAALLPDMGVRAVRDLTGDARAPDVLANLARYNYFTQVLVHREKQVLAQREEPAYRFHPLFRAFLLNQARHAFTAEHLADLQRRAARVLEDRGNAEDAIDLLHQAGDWDNAARLIVAHAPALAMGGRLQTLETWVSRLPAPFADRSPWLLYWLSQCRLGFDPAVARADAERAYALFDAADDVTGLYLAWTAVVVSYVLECVDFKPLDNWFSALKVLQHRHPVMPSVEIEAGVAGAVLGALMWRAENVDLDYWRDRAARIIYGYDSGQPLSQRILLCAYLFMDATVAARIGEAEILAGILRPLVASPNAAPLPRILGYGVLATGNYQRGAREEWMVALTAARVLSAESAVHHVDNMVFHSAVYGALMTDDLPAAQGFLRDMDRTTAGDSRISDVAIYHHCAAMVAMCQGDMRTAQEHNRRALEIVVSIGAVIPEVFCRLCMAQILFACGDAVTAREHLRQADRTATRMGFRTFEYACALSEAHFALELGHTAQGLEHLRRALAMSRRAEGRFFPFWPRATLVKLFSTALRHDIEVEHVQCMIRRLNIIPDVPPVDVEYWPWAVKIYTLDRFTVLLQDGQPLSFTGKTQKRPLELLRALIAHGGREVGVQILIDALWGDVDGDAGQGSFNSTLHRLRKLLGEEHALVVQDGRLTLSAHYVWVDAWAFNRTLGHSDEAVRAGDGARIEELTNKVFALYRAPFLGGIDMPWVVPLRERLRSRFLQHILHVGGHYEHAQRWPDAARLYERALGVEPLAEELYRRLMTAYRHLDRHADALMIYQRCERALTGSLGVPPSRETRLLRDGLRVEQ